MELAVVIVNEERSEVIGTLVDDASLLFTSFFNS